MTLAGVASSKEYRIIANAYLRQYPIQSQFPTCKLGKAQYQWELFSMSLDSNLETLNNMAASISLL